MQGRGGRSPFIAFYSWRNEYLEEGERVIGSDQLKIYQNRTSIISACVVLTARFVPCVSSPLVGGERSLRLQSRSFSCFNASKYIIYSACISNKTLALDSFEVLLVIRIGNPYLP
eukprot:IDg19779t1